MLTEFMIVSTGHETLAQLHSSTYAAVVMAQVRTVKMRSSHKQDTWIFAHLEKPHRLIKKSGVSIITIIMTFNCSAISGIDEQFPWCRRQSSEPAD